MYKSSLDPLDPEITQKMVVVRGITIGAQISILLRDEAVIEFAGKRIKPSCPMIASVRPEPAQVSNKIPIASVPTNIPPVKKKYLLRRILCAIFAGFRILGRVILDILRCDKASDTTAIILGCATIAVILLLLEGVLDLNTLLTICKQI
jgi:hypothetical protein